MKKMIVIGMMTLASSAFANYDLANNGREVTCFADDNQAIQLSADRTTVEYEIEGEGEGPNPIKKSETDGKSYASYTTSEGTLTLSNDGDTFQFDGESEAFPIDCSQP